MTEKLIVEKIDETWLKLHCDNGILQELSEEFKFEVPGAKYTPKYKARVWDGFIRLISIPKRKTYLGLVNQLKSFCLSRGYEFETVGLEKGNITPQEVVSFVDNLKLPFNPRDYQYMSVYKSLKEKHTIIQSPTGSGKSLQIYCLIKQIIDFDFKKILLVVPTVNLVNQMKSDFQEYSINIESDIDYWVHLIYSGHEKDTKKVLTISTWQSIYKKEAEWFQQFDALIVDEVHLAKADSLKGILEKSTNAEYKVGFTGSLDNSVTHRMMLTSLFGEPYKVASTKELIDRGMLSDIVIKCIVMKYDEQYNKAFKKTVYQKEIDFIVQYEPRNKFIRNLALSTEGITLILFNFIDKHGEYLYELLKNNKNNRKVHYIHGATDADSREEIRQILKTASDDIILASLGTFSTGVNVPNIQNIIAAHPTKSMIRVLQSIGRGLRKHESKEKLKWFDISDMFVSNKSAHKNHTYRHFVERLSIYNKENFEYSITEVNLYD